VKQVKTSKNSKSRIKVTLISIKVDAITNYLIVLKRKQNARQEIPI